jgi:hypothetical protein
VACRPKRPHLHPTGASRTQKPKAGCLHLPSFASFLHLPHLPPVAVAPRAALLQLPLAQRAAPLNGGGVRPCKSAMLTVVYPMECHDEIKCDTRVALARPIWAKGVLSGRRDHFHCRRAFGKGAARCAFDGACRFDPRPARRIDRLLVDDQLLETESPTAAEFFAPGGRRPGRSPAWCIG